jgi:hypothetical protein
MEGNKRLAWQKGSRAIFAEAFVSVQKLSEEHWSIEIPNNIDNSWKIGIRFGIELFRECFGTNAKLTPGVHIKVTEFTGQSVDTTLLSIAYVIFHALGNAMHIDGSEIFKFDTGNGDFIM